MSEALDLKTFLNLPSTGIAQMVRDSGPKVCVFPINGSRRWYMLEYTDREVEDYWEAYLRASEARSIEVYKLFFDHGIGTLLSPIFGPDLLERGEGYQQIACAGMLRLAQSAEFLDFYEAYDIRVRMYGDARRYLKNTVLAPAIDAFDDLTRRTASHQRHRLFFGVCAQDASETVGKIAVDFYQVNGVLPNKRQIVETYYGEYVDPVSFFVGFDRPAAFDMPLVATGSEDLYFTVSPSLYLDDQTLRCMLYDHLFARRVDDMNYDHLTAEDWQTIANFYAKNRRHVLGLGRRHPSGNFWYPLPEVELTPPLDRL